MALKENYKDDILDVSVNTKRKYKMTDNGDGTVSFDDETVYTQEGDSFGAGDMNAVNSEVNEVVNNLGAKNMLPNNATTQTINGITFTVNNDGSVTVNGTASGVASLFLIGSTSAWGSNQYKNCILSGCPSGGSGDSYRIVMQTSSDGSAISKTYLEDGNGVLIDDDNQYCKIYIRIAGGYTANNLIFKPMIRLSGIKDDTYAPYAQTNKELTDNLNGFKFYPTGTGIVGLISDDSAYTDANGKYVIWGTATANQLVEDNPNTYKSVPSEEDTRGEVGADTAIPFKSSIKNILPKLGITASDYTLTNTGHVNYSNLEVDETHVKVSVRATSGPSGQTWMAYSEVVSNKSVDLTAYNTILFDGDGKVDQHVGYSKPSYMQIWFENVDNTNDKIYLHNHSSDYTENVTWTKKYVDITNASGKYKLHLYISEEDQQQVDYINLTKIYAFNITD